MKDISKQTPYWTIIGVSLFILATFLIMNQGFLIWYGDSFEQQLNFYLGGWEKFHALDFSLWSWSLGLGANYLSYIFYFASSPFFFLALLFPKSWVPYLFSYLNCMKIALLLLFSYQWLLNLSQKRIYALIGAFALGFSGWVIFFFHYNHFLDAFVFYPLVLLYLEKWLKMRRFFGLSLSIGWLGLVNYYFLYMFIPFIGLYAIYRLWQLNDKFPWKRLSAFIGIGALGVGLSAVLLLPSISIILQTPRLGQSVGFLDHISFKDIFRYLSTLVSPVMERFDPTYYLSTEVYQGLGWGGGVSLYTSILTIVLLPFSFLKTEVNRKPLIHLGFYLLLGFFMFFMIFYKLFQGSIDVRWYYMVTLLNTISLVYALHALDSRKELARWTKYSGILVVVLMSLLYWIAFKKAWVGNPENAQSLKWSFLLLIGLILVYLILVKRASRFLLVLMMFETLFNFYTPIIKDRPMEPSSYRLTFSENSPAIQYLKESDKGFYRILNDTVLYTSPNEPFAKNYPGLSFYLSLYNFQQEDYLNRLKGTWSMPQSFGRNYSYQLLSVKYFVTRDNNHIAPYGFDYFKKIGNESIYRNRYYFALGFYTDKTFNEADFRNLSYLNQDRLMMDTIITTESRSHEPEYFNELETIYAWVKPDRIRVPGNGGDNNIIVESFDIPSITLSAFGNRSVLRDHLLFRSYTWQYNYTGLTIRDSDKVDAVDIDFNNQYDSPTLVNVYRETDLTKYDDWFKRINNQGFTDVRLTSDRIKANILINKENAWVFTSVPYDSGWTLRVDGQNRTFDKVNLGFIGFRLEPGNHQIELAFTPVFLKEGGIVSLISLSILIFLTYRTKQSGLK